MKQAYILCGETCFVADYSVWCEHADASTTVGLLKILGDLCPLETLQML